MTTANAATPERARLTLGETLADSRVMAVRQLRKVLRRQTYIAYLFVQPVIFVLLFRYVFGGAIDTGELSYVDYLIPGIMVMTAIFGALTTGLGLTEDIKAGVVDRFRSLPIARSAVLIGRTAADLSTNLVSLIVMLLIGFAVGFRPSEPVYEVVFAILLVLAFAYVFSWVSAFVGVTVRDPETAQGLGFIWVFPLVFRLLGVRPDHRYARGGADVCGRQPCHSRRRRRARSHGRQRRRAGPDARHPRLARRAPARVRAAHGPRLPARLTDPETRRVSVGRAGSARSRRRRDLRRARGRRGGP
jgi:ABC-2 type transporter